MSAFVWTFPATVVRVVDGDSVVCDVQFSAVHEDKEVDIRVEGINALELSEKFGGEARDYARGLLPEGTAVILIHRKREKFGRFLAKIGLPSGDDFGTLMLTALASDGATHFAVPYMT